MTPAFTAYPSLEAALNARYRGHDARDREEWSARHHYAAACDIPATADRASLRRAGRNYAGLGEKGALRHLVAANVDQPMLDEIGKIAGLERLELGWPTLAADLSPLGRLSRLRFLSIDSPRKVTDFGLLARIASLRTLMIENARHLDALDWLAEAHHLEVIGIEGGMDTKQTIASLAPLAGLKGLEAFLGTSLRVLDRDLMPLASCPRLKFIGIARLARKPAFDALHSARPDIVCAWFKDSMWRR